MMLLSPEPRFESTAHRGGDLRVASDQDRATRAMELDVSDRKTASVDFFENPTQTSWNIPSAAQDLCREKVASSTTTVSGVLVLRNRYYDPNLGRFLSIDAHPGYAMIPQSLNPYIYCNNDPVTYVDPLGLEPLKYSPPELKITVDSYRQRSLAFDKMITALESHPNKSYTAKTVDSRNHKDSRGIATTGVIELPKGRSVGIWGHNFWHAVQDAYPEASKRYSVLPVGDFRNTDLDRAFLGCYYATSSSKQLREDRFQVDAYTD